MSLNIEEAVVSISVIKVGKKQMTKSVFLQIPNSTVYKNNGSLKDNIILLGRVKQQNFWWLIYTLDGELFKCNVEPLNSVPSVEGQEADIESLKARVKSFWSEELGESLVQAQMKLLEIINANKAIEEVKNLKQLYIAI